MHKKLFSFVSIVFCSAFFISAAFCQTNAAPVKVVLVEGGSFMMGGKDAGPIHKMSVASFYMMTTEVTQELYTEIHGENPSYHEGKNLPVELVSWIDVAYFANALSKRDGLKPVYTFTIDYGVVDPAANGWRMPTEAEWEYAARGGKLSKNYTYSGSDKIDEVAWYAENSGRETRQVGQKKPNELGLYDMSGNVGEWCNDLFDDYSAGIPSSPSELIKKGNTYVFFVYRGGHVEDNPEDATVTFRHNDTIFFKGADVGIRLVRNVK